MLASAVRVGTVRSTIYVSSDHPAPERVRADVDDALRSRLRSALGAAFPVSRMDRDTSVWLVRRLELEAHVDAAWDEEQLARTVARAITRSLGRALNGDGDGINVIRFPDRASYLARYLFDRASGNAGQWYYGRFEGLRMLSASAAVTTAIERDPALGLQALRALDGPSRRRVVDVLTQNDAGRLGSELGRLPAAGDLDECLSAVVAAAVTKRERGHGDVTKDALELLVLAWAENRSGGLLAVAAETVARIQAGAAGLGRAHHARLVSAVRAGDPSAVARIAPELVEAVATLASTGDQARAVVADALARAESPPAPVPGEVYGTRFGGALFLLPDLESVSLADLPDGRALPGHVAPLALARAVVLASCLQPDAMSAVLADDLLRRLLGVTNVDLAEAVSLLSSSALSCLHAAARRTMASFSNRLPGFGGSQPAYIRTNFLDVHATAVWEPQRIVARVARPPLHVVLSLAGMTRRRYDLSWLGAIPIEVFPEE